MRKALLIAVLIAVLLVLVVAGLPLPMAMGACHDCGPALLAGASSCVAVLIAFALLVVMASQRLRPGPWRASGLRHAFVLERPPRLA